MTKLLKFWPLAAALLGFLWWQSHDAAVRREGALQERLAGLEQRNAKLEDEAGRIDTVYLHDTLRLTVTRHVTDSILLTDTVYSRERVTQIVKDERQACNAVVLTCEQQTANLRAQVANLDSTITVLNKQRPGWFKKATGKLGWMGAGVVAGVILSK